MTEEEKKAMWYLEEVLVDTTTDIEQWKVIENLIDKQQKEIQRFKDLLVKIGYKELTLTGKEEWKLSE